MKGVLFIRCALSICLISGCELLGVESQAISAKVQRPGNPKGSIKGISNSLLKQAQRIEIGEAALLTQAERLDFVKRMRKEAAVKAFLDVISFAEGSFKNRPYEHSLRGYLLRYPNVSFVGFEDHPQIVICSSSLGMTICSSAAGRYMFLYKTWKQLARILGLKDFSPGNQDLGAIYLLWQHDALDDILHGRFERAVRKVCDIWASFPGSSYGQPQKRMKDLKKLFEERLQYYLNGGQL